MFYIGCPLWSYKEWVGNFFPAHTPPRDFLRFYSNRLPVVEGNTVFYALPSLETITRWCRETPPTFRFCPKVSRSISHDAQLEDCKDQTLFFVERMGHLGTRLGPIFLQLPPTFGPTRLQLLEAFLDYWPEDVQLAVEVRHADFYLEQQALILNTLLHQHNVARVMMDTRPIRIGSKEEQQHLQARERKPDLPLQITTTTNFTFLRYIGHPRPKVNEPLLDQWSQQIAHWLKEDKMVYVFCHCPYEKHSPEICTTLYEWVRKLVPLPPLTLQQAAEAPEIYQPRLF